MAKNRKKKDGVSHPTANSDNPASVEAPIVSMGNAERKSHKTAKNMLKRQRYEAEAEEIVVDINGSDIEKEVEKEAKTNGDDGEIGFKVYGDCVEKSEYKPFETIADPRIPHEALDCCYNINSPSPIEAHSWPFILAGRDFIGIAPTGSKKTLAFGIPGIVHILRKQKESTRKDKPLFLVLSCTRESAINIADELFNAGKHKSIRSVCVYGEDSKRPQIRSLAKGADIVIGTPYRLNELVVSNLCQLDEVSYVVLDESDRLLDLGFETEVREILDRTCTARQMVMFSATWPLPQNVLQLAEEYMGSRPVIVDFSSKDLSAHHNVMQIVEVLEDGARDDRLVTLFKVYHKARQCRVLVFVMNSEEASQVEKMLSSRKFDVVSISGDKVDDTKALASFKNKTYPLLIVTDVVAQGLDIPDVDVVINYSFPSTINVYVERLGRTGQAGRGLAITFFTKENKGLSSELINVLKEDGQVVPQALLNLAEHVKKGITSGIADATSYEKSQTLAEINKSLLKELNQVKVEITAIKSQNDKMYKELKDMKKSPLTAEDCSAPLLPTTSTWLTSKSHEFISESYEEVVTPVVLGKRRKKVCESKRDEEVTEEGASKKKLKKNVAANEATLHKLEVETEKKKIVKKHEGRDDSEDEQKAKAPPTPSKTLHMKNLDYHIQEADVVNFFKGCGEVINVDFSLRFDGTRNGAGHVQFATAETAKKALKEKNRQILKGRKVFLNFATAAGRDAKSNKESGGSQLGLTIFVQGIDYNSEPNSLRNALRELFSSCGEVTRVGVPRDKNGFLKGTALIDFSSTEEVDRALKLDGHKLGGYCIKVRVNKPLVGPPNSSDSCGSGFSEKRRFCGKKTIFSDDD